jgi:hypothetical protein
LQIVLYENKCSEAKYLLSDKTFLSIFPTYRFSGQARIVEFVVRGWLDR